MLATASIRTVTAVARAGGIEDVDLAVLLAEARFRSGCGSAEFVDAIVHDQLSYR